MSTYEINPDFIKILDPEVEVIEKLTIHRPFDFGSGSEKWTNSGKPGAFTETQESDIRWSRSEGLVITRVKYFVVKD